mgnify:CR=1 FL=1
MFFSIPDRNGQTSQISGVSRVNAVTNLFPSFGILWLKKFIYINKQEIEWKVQCAIVFTMVCDREINV